MPGIEPIGLCAAVTNGTAPRAEKAPRLSLDEKNDREIVMSAKSLLDRSEVLPDEETAPTLTQRALAIVDEALADYAGRQLISGDEVIDRLLDLRNALAAESLLHDLDALEAL